jgi:arylsulfatase A-like enzyme
MPGRSFAQVLRGGQGGHGAVVVCDEYGPTRMIREKRWKYVHRYPFGPHELYDLEHDPGEVTNLVADPGSQHELERLRAGLTDWFSRYVDPEQDGARLPVTGKGQIDLADRRNEGRRAFEPYQGKG